MSLQTRLAAEENLAVGQFLLEEQTFNKAESLMNDDDDDDLSA
jgi:hypothetical protein